MRWATALVTLVLLTANVAAAPAAYTHTRPLSDAARNLVSDARARSPFIKSLIDGLEDTDLVVFVALSMSGFDADFHGDLTFVCVAAGVRYVLIKIDSLATTPDQRTELLGHELRHATEVSAAPEVRDRASFAGFYKRIGRPARAGGYETDAAQSTTYLVRNELANGQPG